MWILPDLVAWAALCPLQFLRVYDAEGLLAMSLVECFKAGYFPLLHRPFEPGGINCDCLVDTTGPTPSDAAWAATYKRLPAGPDGCPRVCDVCGKTDKCGTHSPELM